MDTAIASMVQDMAKQSLVVIILLLVVYSNQDSALFEQNNSIKNIFMNHEAPDFPGKLYKVIEDHVIRGLYYDYNYNARQTTLYEKKFITHMEGYRIGSPVIRQLRVLPEKCHIANPMPKAVDRCGKGFSIPVSDTNQYLPGWQFIFNTSQKTIESHPVGMAFMYSSSKQLKKLAFWGTVTTYSGGGYAISLGESTETALKTLYHLKQSVWLDNKTRAVFLDFNVINMDSNLFSTVSLLYEFPQYGGCFTRHEVATLELYRYNGGKGLIALVFEILSLLTMVIIIILLIKDMIGASRRRERVFNLWRTLRLLLIVFYILAMIAYVFRMLYTKQTLEEIMNNKESTVSFDRVKVSSAYFMSLLGFAVFIAHVELLYILRYNIAICTLTKTLINAGHDLLSMTVVGAIIFIAFVFCMTLLFGNNLSEYANIPETCMTLVRAALGNFDYHPIKLNFGSAGAFILVLYLLFITILAMNLFITLLNLFFEETSDDPNSAKFEQDVMEHFLSTVKNFLIPKKN